MGIGVIHRNKVFLLLTASFVIIILFILSEPKETGIYLVPLEPSSKPKYFNNEENGKIQLWWTLRNSTKHRLSNLGTILFLDHPEPITETNKTYQILVWKYGSTIENRHLKHFSGKKTDPFAYCSVKNCDITYKDEDLNTADIVIFHLHRVKGLADIPNRHRNPNQIWTFLTDESPYNTFLKSKNKLADFNGIFNWSMSYRMDSDIPVPYGRTTLRKPPTEENLSHHYSNKRKDVLVAILGSNCGGNNHRWRYVKELQKYIQVDVYGGCGTTLKKECPGHFGSDCPAIDAYLFYLSFENSNCDEYITEKLWWNAYHKNSIPIVMGSSQETYKKLLPPDSYINVDQFANPQALAKYLLRLNETGEFKYYHSWRQYFQVLNEHGYFQSRSYHYCRICQALNYNVKKTKIYNDLVSYWSVQKDCHPSWDAWVN